MRLLVHLYFRLLAARRCNEPAWWAWAYRRFDSAVVTEWREEVRRGRKRAAAELDAIAAFEQQQDELWCKAQAMYRGLD